jgi:hypothetical protein
MDAYPKKKDTASRLSRKQARNRVFWANKTAKRKMKREKRAARANV